MSTPPAIGRYLIAQLYRHGVGHIFGVPGDYVLGLYQLIEPGPIRLVGTTREDAAGFAADAYARTRGLGAACVTYCVGGLSMANSIAGAYAEKSPVVVISGAPDLRGRERNPLLHHLVRDFRTQHEVYSHFTVASAALEDPATACWEIDRVLHAVERYKRPGYIELPRDLVEASHPHEHRDIPLDEITDEDALEECLAEAVRMLNASARPVILAGEEIQRFGLQRALRALVERANLPVATTVLGKSVIADSHPNSLGVYAGALGRSDARARVEAADCLLMLGCFLTDINLGIYTARLDPSRTISVTSERVSVRRHHFDNVPLESLLIRLCGAPLRRRGRPSARASATPAPARAMRDGARIGARSLLALLGEAVTPETTVVTDVGDCLFGSLELHLPEGAEYVSPAYYSSMGYGVPAALGVQVASPERRPLVLVGDGGFQMTGMELSTIARYGLDPIVVVLNNHGYSTERVILEGSFNDIANWDFTKVVEVIGSGRASRARTVGEMRAALRAGAERGNGPTLIEVDLAPDDISPVLRRLGTELGKRARG